jgi:hypothetical protein
VDEVVSHHLLATAISTIKTKTTTQLHRQFNNRKLQRLKSQLLQSHKAATTSKSSPVVKHSQHQRLSHNRKAHQLLPTIRL